MLHFLHTLSNIQIGLLLVGVLLTFTIIGPCALRYYFKWDPAPLFAEGAQASYAVVVSLALLLLAFCLVRAQGDHRSAEDLTTREAAIMIKLDHSYANFDSDTGDILREDLKKYATLIVQQEWPLLAKQGRSESASNALSMLAANSRTFAPKNVAQQIALSEILNGLTLLTDVREARLATTRIELPIYFWQAILFSIALLVILGWFQLTLSKMVPYCGGVSCAICILITVLISTDGIYIGENAVTARPLELAIEQMNKTSATNPSINTGGANTGATNKIK